MPSLVARSMPRGRIGWFEVDLDATSRHSSQSAQALAPILCRPAVQVNLLLRPSASAEQPSVPLGVRHPLGIPRIACRPRSSARIGPGDRQARRPRARRSACRPWRSVGSRPVVASPQARRRRARREPYPWSDRACPERQRHGGGGHQLSLGPPGLPGLEHASVSLRALQRPTPRRRHRTPDARRELTPRPRARRDA